MMIVFHFMIIMLDNFILKVNLSDFLKCIYLHEMSNLTKWVASKWNIDLKKIKLMKIEKKFMYYQIMHVIIIIYQSFYVK
jgi:hypothetical protein